MNLRELTALILLAAVWGASFFFIRIAVPALGPFPLVAGRVWLAAAVLGLVALVLRRRVRLRPHWRGLLVLGAINAALPFCLISAAELHLTASLAAIMNAMQPLFAAVIGVVWLGERFTFRRSVGLLVGIAGVGVLVGWSPLPMTLPVLLSFGAMVVATILYAIGGIYAKRRLGGVPGPTLVLGQQVAAGVWLLVPTAFSLPVPPPPVPVVWALLGLALLSTAFAYTLYFYLLEHVGPTKTYTVTYVIPVFGILWGVLFLGEVLTEGVVVGLACILVSLVLVNELTFRRSRRDPLAAVAGSPVLRPKLRYRAGERV